MENFDYTISIGQLGEQLTLNQWVLGSSPRWRTKKYRNIRCGIFFLCTIPFGAGSCVAQALAFVSRGPVTKNVPQERFLNAPADAAPKTALHSVQGCFRMPVFAGTPGTH